MRNVSFTHRSGFLILCLAVSACGTAMEGEVDEVETISAVQQPAVIGNRKVAAIFIRFKNSPEPTYTSDDVRDRLFSNADSTNNFFIEASYGKMSLTGHVNPNGDYFGWYTINAEPTSCSLRPAYAAMGRAIAATVAGYVESNYQHTMYFFAERPAGCTDGAAALGSSTYFYSAADSGTFAHELGHNLGLGHSDLLNCANAAGNWASMSTSCAQPNLPACANSGELNAGSTSCVQEYGDSFSTMGGQFLHYNAPEKALLGWFDPENTETVSASGTSIVSVEPIELASDGVQRLVVPIPGGDETYQVEYRQPLGLFDSQRFTAGSPVASGIVVHRGTLEGTPTRIVNMTPSVPIDVANYPANVSREALPWGHTFVDRDADLAISLLGVSPSEATVKVTRGTAAAPIPACADAPSHWYLKCGATDTTSMNAATKLTEDNGALVLTYQVSQSIAAQNGGDVCTLVQTHTAGQWDPCAQYWVPAGGTQASGQTKTLSPDLAGFRITYPAPGNYKASLSASGALSVTPAP
ncbi:hypothetical protein WMF45_27495 [Sorangium sp. So ce448]|uniref:hypothetical protein n=1 Tax=Sorangium sp. So ce448 TaxID=3133314 RepID=UPI003F63B5FD